MKILTKTAVSCVCVCVHVSQVVPQTCDWLSRGIRDLGSDRSATTVILTSSSVLSRQKKIRPQRYEFNTLRDRTQTQSVNVYCACWWLGGKVLEVEHHDATGFRISASLHNDDEGLVARLSPHSALGKYKLRAKKNSIKITHNALIVGVRSELVLGLHMPSIQKSQTRTK